MMTMLLTLLSICVTVYLDYPCTAHAFFPERLSYHC
jgi:hypothetical protein